MSLNSQLGGDSKVTAKLSVNESKDSEQQDTVKFQLDMNYKDNETGWGGALIFGMILVVPTDLVSVAFGTTRKHLNRFSIRNEK